MANSLLKLTVDSSEYDAKLKKAAEGVRHLADVAHKSAGDMTGLEQSTLDYIKSIGEMETKSRTAAGQVRELESTYKELKVIYDQLNDVEKADEGGKALAASLEQLKQRAQDAKKSLDDASKSLQQNEGSSKQDSSAISDLTSKLGINVKSLVGWGAALGAGKMALDVLKDSLFSSESFVDEWGRTVAASEGVYQSFLQSLNTGDFSGFLNNIGQVTQAAKDAYNALDELGTRMTIINPERAKLQARQQELRATIRREGANSEAGKKATAELKSIEPQLSKSYKAESQMNRDAFEKLVRQRLTEGGINLNQRSFNDLMKTFSSDAAFQQMRSRARGSSELKATSEVGKFQTIDTRNTEQKLMDLFTDEWRKQNSGYLTAAFNAQGAAASNALSNARYLKGGGGGSGKGGTTTTANGIKDEFTDMEELVGLIPVAEKKVKDLQQQIRESWDEGEIAKLTKELKVAEDEVKRLKDIGKPVDLEKMFPDYSKQNYNTGYAGSTKAKIDSARQDFALSTTNFDTINSYISGIKNALKDADLGSDLYNSLTEQLKDATTMSTMLQELMERGLQGSDLQSVAEKFKTALLEGDVPDDKIKEYIDKLNEQIKNAGGIELSYNEKTGEVKDKDKKKSDRDVLKDSKQLVSGLSQVAGGLQQMGVKLPEEVQQVLGVVQGLMTVIEGVNTVIGITQTAALTANTTAMVALTSALWANTATSIIPFANGGIVPHAANGYFIGGTHMSGDVTPIMANAGELVLNRAQQGNLASQLSDGGGNGNLRLETYVSGRDLRIVLNNESQGRLKGKYVTSNNVR